MTRRRFTAGEGLGTGKGSLGSSLDGWAGCPRCYRVRLEHNGHFTIGTGFWAGRGCGAGIVMMDKGLRRMIKFCLFGSGAAAKSYDVS